MKSNLTYTATAFAVSITIMGCQKDDESASDGVSKIDSQIVEHSDRATQTVDDALTKAQDAAARTKEEFMAATDRTLREIDAAVSELSQTTSVLTEEAKAGAESAMIKFKQQRREVAAQVEKAKTASMEAWAEEIRPGLESALEGLKAAYEDVKSNWPQT